MKEEEKIDKVLRIAEIGNYTEHSNNLLIPILKGLEIREIDEAQVILFADYGHITEQLITDGYVEKDEISDRLKKIIEESKSFMKDIGCINVEDSFLFHKDYENDYFKFKVYVQDIIYEEENKKSIIRQMNAYFYEPVGSDYYQFSLSTGPFDLEHTNIIVGVIDLEHDIETKKLDERMNSLLDNLKYKD